MTGRILLIVVTALWSASCGTHAAPGGADPGQAVETEEEGSLLAPPGFGTLAQDQITLRIRKGNLLIKVTPLAEWVIRLTAPDTYARLQGMVRTRGGRAAAGALSTSTSLFLVSFFSYQPDVTYEPEDLLLVNRGLRYRSTGIAPVTPSWGTQRLGQQETQLAVYAFEGDMDLERDLVVEYQELRNDTWRDRIVPLLMAELAKARARAGGGAVGG